MISAKTPHENSSPLLAGIEHSIAIVQKQISAQEAVTPDVLRGETEGRIHNEIPYPLEDLSMFLLRLQQMKTWFQEDQRLLPVIDDYISAHVRKTAQKQARQNLVLAMLTTLIGAILGWLLSALLPATLLLSH